MVGKRSSSRFIHHPLEIKPWFQRVPSVSEARPARCPACKVAGHPHGGKLMLHGHGLRPRQIWGPLFPGGPPRETEILVRRFRCRRCGAVCSVGPLGVIPGYLFSAPAIAWALCLYGMARRSAARVRRRVSPWSRHVGHSAAGCWHSLKRWAQAVKDRKLFPSVRRFPEDFSPRQVAERTAATFIAACPPFDRELPEDHRAWHGAAQPGRAIIM